MPAASHPITVSDSATRRGPLARLVAGVWMVVHLLVVAAVPVADAHTPHTDEIVAHWEDAEQSDCPPTHLASDCQLCQAVSSARALPAASATPIVADAGVTRPPTGHDRGRIAAIFLAGHSSRAPPLG